MITTQQSINNLDTKIDKVIEDLTGGDATVDLDVTSKLDRGSTNYADAAAIESAVTTLETTKAHVDHDHDLDYATKDELSTEASDRVDGDAQTLQDAKDYADTISVDTSDKFDKGTGPLNYADATALGNAVDALSSGSGYDDSGVKADIANNAADIATNATEIAKKFDDGGQVTYTDAKAMEDAIKTNTDAITSINNNGAYDDTELRGLIGDKFDTNDGAGTSPTTLTNAKDMEDAIGANASRYFKPIKMSLINSQNNLHKALMDLTVELESYLKKGTGLVAGDAKTLEDAIKKNADDIALLRQL